MFVQFLKSARGYVKLRLTGYAPERFMNLCSSHDILLWGVEHEGKAYLFCVNIEDFFKLKPLLKKTYTKVRILERRGLPFFLHRYRKRKVFGAGAILFFAILYILSLFIWDINIEGNYTLTTDILMDYLAEENVKTGMLKRNIDCEEIEKKLRSKYNNITWTSVKKEGTRLLVGIKENITSLPGEEEALPVPSDLLAERDGIIVSIITRSGTPAVGIHHEVKAGDLLVSGTIPVLNDAGETAGYQYTAADADIVLQTVYEYHDSFSRNYQDKVYTEKEKQEVCFLINGKRLELKLSKVSYAQYDTLETKNQIRLGNSFYLPLWIEKKVHREYESIPKLYTKEECKKIAQDNLKRFMQNLEEKGVQIIQNDVKIEISDKNLEAKGSLIVLEPTGKRIASDPPELPAAIQEEAAEE